MSKVGQLQRGMIGAESATEAEIVEGRAREGELDEHEEMMIILSLKLQVKTTYGNRQLAE